MSEKHTDIAVMKAAAIALNEKAQVGREALQKAALMLIDGATVEEVIDQMRDVDTAFDAIAGSTELTLGFVVELVTRFAGASKKDDRQQQHIDHLEQRVADLQVQLAAERRERRTLERDMDTAVESAWQTGMNRGFEQAGMTS